MKIMSPFSKPPLFLLLVVSIICFCRLHPASASGSDDFLQSKCLSVPTSSFVGSVTSTIDIIRQVVSVVSRFSNTFGDFRLSNAISDCLDLLDFSADELSWSVSATQNPNNKDNSTGDLSSDLRTWLSATLANQETCIDGFEGTSSIAKNVIGGSLNQVTSLVQDLLTMVHPVPKGGKSGKGTHGGGRSGNSGFPWWFKREDRKLLEGNGLTADAVVAADGSGNYTSVMDAVSAAPDESAKRFVIYIKKGVYRENVEIKKKKWNLMMIGDGMNDTIITGNRSFGDGWTTFRSATFAVSGRGFIAQDMTFENTAGPEKHQAVALRSDSDLSVFYRCSIKGYQDSLYTHTMRQFFRECNISGTVDFIFGDGTVVFQHCQILAKKGLPNQKNTITAQGRKDPNQPTGFAIQFCNITADSDLLPLVNSTETYLGRPWKPYSRTAFQHYIVMLGTTVLIANNLVPQMGGDHGDKARVVQTLVFMSGINTLLQTLLGSRLPSVMGPSIAFLLPVLSIINDNNNRFFASEHERFRHNMRTIQGSLIISSFVNIILGYSMAWGSLTRLFSPIVIVPVVCLSGLGLFLRGFPLLGNCVEIGLPMLILLVVCQQYLRRIHPRASFLVERFALLFCIALVWAFAAILTVAGAYNNVSQRTKMSCRTDRSYLISSAPWVKIPYPFQWGTPIFRASHVFGMMGAALVCSTESTAAFFAASRLAGATAPPAYVLSRSIGLQGIGMLLEGIFGAAVGTAASVENVGLLGLTHIGSRRVVQISTAFMIFFSIFGKFGAFFASIPLPIFAAIYCVLLGIVAAVGITFIQFTNNNSIRNIYVFGLSLFLGLSISQYFVLNTNSSGRGPVKTEGGWFDDILNTIFSSPPTVAMIVGTLLDNTLEARYNIDDRGIPWWKPFQHRKGDVRTEEFYGLPLRINEYLPTRFM